MDLVEQKKNHISSPCRDERRCDLKLLKQSGNAEEGKGVTQQVGFQYSNLGCYSSSSYSQMKQSWEWAAALLFLSKLPSVSISSSWPSCEAQKGGGTPWRNIFSTCFLTLLLFFFCWCSVWVFKEIVERDHEVPVSTCKHEAAQECCPERQ